MKKYSLSKCIYYTLGIVCLVIIWNLISKLLDNSSFIFPNFFVVIKETVEILKGSYIYKCLYYTLSRMFIGFACSIVLSIAFGTLAGLNSKFKSFLTPFITLLKTVPTASLVFLFLVVSGAKYAPIYIVILICFPIIYESTVSGYENIDPQINDTLNLEKGNELVKVLKVRFPMCLPYIKIGIASSFGLSFKIEIMSEILTGSTTNGLGSAISYIQKSEPTNMTGIFAYSLIAIMISLIFDLILKLIENRTKIS